MMDAPNASAVVTRVTSNDGPDYIRIEVKMPSYQNLRPERVRVVVEMTPEAFAYAITGRAGTPCFAEIL
jgi:hypothetical protein